MLRRQICALRLSMDLSTTILVISQCISAVYETVISEDLRGHY